ncbi:MAG: hypothetical protein ABL903_08940 [Methylococcales bacterium]
MLRTPLRLIGVFGVASCAPALNATMTVTDSPFHVSRWPKAIIHPDDYDGGDTLSLTWDLGSVDESVKKKAINAWTVRLPTLTHLKRLQLWTHVTQPVFNAACELQQLEVFQIKWSNIQDLEAISGLQSLRALSIGSSTRVKSIEPIGALQSLTLLELENLKSISNFSPLRRLKALKSLAVTGSMWSRQAIESLDPFASMTWLTSLAIDTSSVSSLRPLSWLVRLRELGLGGRLPFEEYAWLSAMLPNTECRWFAPFYDLVASGYGACKSCHRDSMVMLTGKGKPVLCKHCDAAKVAKHVALFEAARASARSDD